DRVLPAAQPPADEVRADEAGTAADEQPHRCTAIAASARYADRPSAHGGSGCGSRSEASTLHAGRAAARVCAALVVAVTRTSYPVAAKIACANSCREQCPAAAAWKMPARRSAAISISFSARCPVNVGQPTWSVTT